MKNKYLKQDVTFIIKKSNIIVLSVVLLILIPTMSQIQGQITEKMVLESEFISTPRKQVLDGVSFDEVECKDGYKLIFRNQDASPTCVRLSSSVSLIERGWVMQESQLSFFKDILESEFQKESLEFQLGNFGIPLNEINPKDNPIIQLRQERQLNALRLLEPIIEFSTNKYYLDDTARIIVTHSDANTDPNRTETVKVTITSNLSSLIISTTLMEKLENQLTMAGPDYNLFKSIVVTDKFPSESVYSTPNPKSQIDIILTETGPNSGIFVGTFTINDVITSVPKSIGVVYSYKSDLQPKSKIAVASVIQTPLTVTEEQSVPVWRAQIRLITGDQKAAGTDSHVRVKLNSNHDTWIDYGRNDFQRNDDFTYDLTLENVQRVDDITQLRISKTGKDGWCLEEARLIINNERIYRYVSNWSNGCTWLDNPNGHDGDRILTISSSDLRSHPYWQNYDLPNFPESFSREEIQQFLDTLTMSRNEIESRIEGIVGDQIRYEDAYWGHLHGRAVEAWRTADDTVHVDLDLAVDISGWWDPEIDIDFDLVFDCVNGEIFVTTENFVIDTDSRWYSEVLSLGIIEFVDNGIDDAVEDSFQRISLTLADFGDFGAPVCPTITVNNNANNFVVFGIPDGLFP